MAYYAIIKYKIFIKLDKFISLLTDLSSFAILLVYDKKKNQPAY
jgi:hypothetical protein